MMISPKFKVTVLAPVFPRMSQHEAIAWVEGQTVEPWQAQLTRLLEVSSWDAQHLPAAELFLRSNDADKCSSVKQSACSVVCADPVHFRADRDSATLIPAEKLQLQAGEAEALLETINDFVQEDGLRFVRTEDGRWYMTGKDGTELASYPPSFLAYRNASAFLANDVASGDWRRLMTELQMLLHTHPVNKEREQRGVLPVNSVWFWGGAALHSTEAGNPELHSTLQLHADDEYTVALADHLGINCKPLDTYSPASAHPHTLLVDTRLAQALFNEDEEGLALAEACIVDSWIAPLVERIKQGDEIEITIVNEDGIQGLINAELIRAKALAERVARDSRLSATARLSSSLAFNACKLWQRLTGKL